MKKIDITKHFMLSFDRKRLNPYPDNTYLWDFDNRIAYHRKGKDIIVYEIATGLGLGILRNCKVKDLDETLKKDIYKKFLNIVINHNDYYTMKIKEYNNVFALLTQNGTRIE